MVTYAFSSKKPGYDTVKRSGFTKFGEEHKKHAREALKHWADASGLTFVEVPESKGGQIRFAMENMVGRDAAGFAHFPLPDYAYNEATGKWDVMPGFRGDDVGGDVFLLAKDFAKEPDAIRPGPWSWLLVHEIGHALGFKHPHDGTPKLGASLDNIVNTVLSYNYAAGYQGGIGSIDKKAVKYYYGSKSFDVDYNKKTLKVGITSTNKAEHLLGTELDDTLRALGGNDTVRAGPGNDVAYGGGGNDRVYGGDGNDRLHGGGGGDRLQGDAGNDLLYGGAGNDRIEGGTQRDVLYGDAGGDLLHGGAGDDRLYGGANNDRLYGDEGGDGLYGGAGADRLYGGAGKDSLYGGGGNDRLYGEDGSDRLYGGGGNDRFYGGAGNDRIYGGGGADQVHFSGSYDDYVVTSSGDTTIVQHRYGLREDGTDRLAGVEYLVFSDGILQL